MHRKILCLMIFAALAATVCAPRAMAFNAMTKKDILQDAIAFSPEHLRNYLEKYKDVVESGINYDVWAGGYIHPLTVGNVYRTLSVRVQTEPYSHNTLRGFGVLAGLVAEAIYPGDNFSSLQISPAEVKYDGIDKVGDPDEMAEALIETYRPYWKKTDRQVREILFEHAVNKVVDVWVAVWEDGGLDPGKPVETGKTISHAHKVLATPEEETAKGGAPSDLPPDAPPPPK
ncbi:MAG: hypothetical protein JRI97_09970 [Deltaproteobacteria bacterium]|nr:hypothetical protein [Deltaproteobacteria bacterium]